MHFVYIIYSSKLDRNYIGETSDLQQRVLWHNEHLFSEASTKNAKDWEIIWSLECHDISQARKIETFIKKMKSKVFIEKIVQDKAEWLLEKFCSS